MKKNILVVLILAGITAVTSCQKKDADKLESKPLKFKKFARTAGDDENAYDNTVDAVAYGLLDLAQDAGFKSLVNQEVAKQFDGDDNVLLITLDSLMTQNERSLAEEMESALVKYGHEELLEYIGPAIHGLPYFEDTLYSQVFIPFIEGKNLSGTVTYICPNKMDEEILPGFAPSADVVGGTITTDVTETMAQLPGNIVWVASINETVTNTGKKGLFKPSPAPFPLKTTSVNDRFLEIEKVFVREKHEGWGNGRADLSHITYIFSNSCGKIVNSGIPYCKLADPEMNQWYVPTFQDGELKILSNQHGQYDADWKQSTQDRLYTILYEADRRKKFDKTHNFNSSCSGNGVEYCSKEDMYGVIEPAMFDFSGTPTNPSTNFYGLNGMDVVLKGYKL